jgi:hypothetical protein
MYAALVCNAYSAHSLAPQDCGADGCAGSRFVVCDGVCMLPYYQEFTQSRRVVCSYQRYVF